MQKEFEGTPLVLLLSTHVIKEARDSRVVIRNGVPVFCSGTEVLEKMRVEEIAELSRRWAQFNRRENPSPEDERERVDELKKAWSTRLMSALSGACSAVLGYFLPRRRQRK